MSQSLTTPNAPPVGVLVRILDDGTGVACDAVLQVTCVIPKYEYYARAWKTESKPEMYRGTYLFVRDPARPDRYETVWVPIIRAHALWAFELEDITWALVDADDNLAVEDLEV